jgi:enoyl-CoA hydratase/carnithine racemase
MSIVVQTDAGVMTIRIDRPDKKNALTIAMYRALTDAIGSSDSDAAVRAIAIVGSPTVFSAGNDLGDFMKAASGGGDAMAPLAFLHAISTAAKPIVAGVGGLAIGIGTTMLLHCDLVYATAAARFRTPFVDLGLVPEAASSLLMPMLMGPRRAAAMLLAGEELDAAGAREVGLINAIVDDAESAAVAAARRLAARPPGAMLASKRLMKRAHAALVAEQIRIEGEVFGERLRSPEAMAAFMAFSQRK